MKRKFGVILFTSPSTRTFPCRRLKKQLPLCTSVFRFRQIGLRSRWRQSVPKLRRQLLQTLDLCPFSDDFESVTMKHCKNKKWFALIMNVNNKLYLNVKTDPNYSDILRNTYDYIIPAYHMNKEHWNTIIVDEKVDKTLVKEMIEQSYQLTK